MISPETRARGAKMANDYWSCLAIDPMQSVVARPDKVTTIMIQLQIALLSLYLPEMDDATARRAHNTLDELESRLL